jgi:ankyrin repeat protein
MYDLTRSQPEEFCRKKTEVLVRCLSSIAKSLGITNDITVYFDGCYSFKYEKMFVDLLNGYEQKEKDNSLEELMLKTIYIAAGMETRSNKTNNNNPQFKTHSGYETEIKSAFKEAKKLGITLDLTAIPEDFKVKGEVSTPAIGLAAKNGYTAMVQLLLENKADVNQIGKNGMTPLLYAAKQNNVEMVRLLVKNRANLKQKAPDGSCALHLSNNLDVINVLLEEKKNINVNALNSRKNTPLHQAVISANFEIVKRLVEAKADPDLPNEFGESPLYSAVKNKDEKMVNYLLTCVVDPNQKTEKEMSPLALAAKNPTSEMLKLLLTHPKIDLAECAKVLDSIKMVSSSSLPLFSSLSRKQQEKIKVDGEKRLLLTQYIEKHAVHGYNFNQ